jgi:Putative zinc- or iron-chelating domain
MTRALDGIWIDAAAELDVPVVRGGDAYVHWDGGALHIAGDEHLDDDDTVAQLVLHELCHWMTQGEASRQTPDWGLDNTSDRDAARELSAVRLQAHLLGAWGLRRWLYPTTVVRPFYEALGEDALATDPLAHEAASCAARAPFAKVLSRALAASAARLDLPLHPATQRPLADGECGNCAWRTDRGFCRVAKKRVSAAARACTARVASLDCLTCGACCREAYDTVDVSAREAARLPAALVESRDGRLHLRRTDGNRCAALEANYSCIVYDARPRTCRDFERGGRHCLDARRSVGLSL